MTRDVLLGATLGAVGMICLVFGVQAWFDAEHALIPALADPGASLGLTVLGVVLCIVEMRILLPALKRMARRAEAGDESER